MLELQLKRGKKRLKKGRSIINFPGIKSMNRTDLLKS